MSANKTGKQTYADYLKTPEGWGYELFDGNIRDMAPAPYTNHQSAAGNLFAELKLLAEKNNLGKVYIAPTDVYFDEHNCVQPDILFISKERVHIITEKNIQGAPDLAVEIVSPSTKHYDTVEKKNLYQRFGVKEYWIVFPEEERVIIFSLKNGAYHLLRTYTKADVLHSQTFSAFKIELTKIFTPVIQQ
ncbi:MAG: Uma2 family endonuclease [Bacteroidetes bacterium]|nr:Uma2 family endonuclease [Bacteroidota bacterium]